MDGRFTQADSEDATHDPIIWRWGERAVQWLDFPLGRFLDYGCGRGGLLEQVKDRCGECHGVDVNKEVIENAIRQYPDCTLKVIGIDGKTDYPDDYFDTIAMVEVIEHVPDERATLVTLVQRVETVLDALER